MQRLLMISVLNCKVPNVDLPPLCSSRFRPGPPCEQAQAASQFIADVIERCKVFSFSLHYLKARFPLGVL